MRARAVPRATRRLDRLATFTFAATLAAAGLANGVGCSSTEEDQGARTTADGGKSADSAADATGGDAAARPDTSAEDSGSVMGMYGAPPVDAASDVTEDGPADDGSMAGAYGKPPTP